MGVVYEITGIAANVCIIVFFVWIVRLKHKFMSVKKYVNKYMENDIDKMIDDIVEERNEQSTSAVDQPMLTGMEAHRERLVAVAASGNSKLYLGKNITTSEIENLEDKEVLKLYSRYETYIGNVMTKSLKSTICKTYVATMSALVPSVSKGKYLLVEGERLSESLIENPVINLALSTWTCKLYHDYGHYLAPLTAGLLTSGHIEQNYQPQPLTMAVNQTEQSNADDFPNAKSIEQS